MNIIPLSRFYFVFPFSNTATPCLLTSASTPLLNYLKKKTHNAAPANPKQIITNYGLCPF